MKHADVKHVDVKHADVKHVDVKHEPAATASSEIPEHDLKAMLRNLFITLDTQRATSARDNTIKKDSKLNSYLKILVTSERFETL